MEQNSIHNNRKRDRTQKRRIMKKMKKKRYYSHLDARFLSLLPRILVEDRGHISAQHGKTFPSSSLWSVPMLHQTKASITHTWPIQCHHLHVHQRTKRKEENGLTLMEKKKIPKRPTAFLTGRANTLRTQQRAHSSETDARLVWPLSSSVHESIPRTPALTKKKNPPRRPPSSGEQQHLRKLSHVSKRNHYWGLSWWVGLGLSRSPDTDTDTDNHRFRPFLRHQQIASNLLKSFPLSISSPLLFLSSSNWEPPSLASNPSMGADYSLAAFISPLHASSRSLSWGKMRDGVGHTILIYVNLAS